MGKGGATVIKLKNFENPWMSRDGAVRMRSESLMSQAGARAAALDAVAHFFFGSCTNRSELDPVSRRLESIFWHLHKTHKRRRVCESDQPSW